MSCSRRRLTASLLQNTRQEDTSVVKHRLRRCRKDLDFRTRSVRAARRRGSLQNGALNNPAVFFLWRVSETRTLNHPRPWDFGAQVVFSQLISSRILSKRSAVGKVIDTSACHCLRAKKWLLFFASATTGAASFLLGSGVSFNDPDKHRVVLNKFNIKTSKSYGSCCCVIIAWVMRTAECPQAVTVVSAVTQRGCPSANSSHLSCKWLLRRWHQVCIYLVASIFGFLFVLMNSHTPCAFSHHHFCAWLHTSLLLSRGIQLLDI